MALASSARLVVPRPGALKDNINNKVLYGDYWVQPLGEKDIERIANAWRAFSYDVFGSDYFNVVDFVHKVFQRRRHRGQRLTIKFIERAASGPPAKVTYEPLTLHVRVDVWEAARKDELWARYIVAHECGHLILHDHEAKGFSSPDAKRLPTEDQVRSAEWQADRFADFLLVPTVISERQSDAHTLAIRCGVPLEIAYRRMSEVQELWNMTATLHDIQQCDHCFGFEARRIDSRVRCACGKMSHIAL